MGSNEIFAIFEEIKSKAESDVENFLEDSNTKLIAEKKNPDKNEDTYWLLKPETVVHVESESNESERPQKKKLKLKTGELKWKRQPKFIKTRKCNLEAKIFWNFP